MRRIGQRSCSLGPGLSPIHLLSPQCHTPFSASPVTPCTILWDEGTQGHGEDIRPADMEQGPRLGQASPRDTPYPCGQIHGTCGVCRAAGRWTGCCRSQWHAPPWPEARGTGVATRACVPQPGPVPSAASSGQGSCSSHPAAVTR